MSQKTLFYSMLSLRRDSAMSNRHKNDMADLQPPIDGSATAMRDGQSSLTSPPTSLNSTLGVALTAEASAASVNSLKHSSSRACSLGLTTPRLQGLAVVFAEDLLGNGNVAADQVAEELLAGLMNTLGDVPQAHSLLLDEDSKMQLSLMTPHSLSSDGVGGSSSVDASFCSDSQVVLPGSSLARGRQPSLVWASQNAPAQCPACCSGQALGRASTNSNTSDGSDDSNAGAYHWLQKSPLTPAPCVLLSKQQRSRSWLRTQDSMLDLDFAAARIGGAPMPSDGHSSSLMLDTPGLLALALSRRASRANTMGCGKQADGLGSASNSSSSADGSGCSSHCTRKINAQPLGTSRISEGSEEGDKSAASNTALLCSHVPQASIHPSCKLSTMSQPAPSVSIPTPLVGHRIGHSGNPGPAKPLAMQPTLCCHETSGGFAPASLASRGNHHFAGVAAARGGASGAEQQGLQQLHKQSVLWNFLTLVFGGAAAALSSSSRHPIPRNKVMHGPETPAISALASMLDRRVLVPEAPRPCSSSASASTARACMLQWASPAASLDTHQSSKRGNHCHTGDLPHDVRAANNLFVAMQHSSHQALSHMGGTAISCNSGGDGNLGSVEASLFVAPAAGYPCPADNWVTPVHVAAAGSRAQGSNSSDLNVPNSQHLHSARGPRPPPLVHSQGPSPSSTAEPHVLQGIFHDGSPHPVLNFSTRLQLSCTTPPVACLPDPCVLGGNQHLVPAVHNLNHGSARLHSHRSISVHASLTQRSMSSRSWADRPSSPSLSKPGISGAGGMRQALPVRCPDDLGQVEPPGSLMAGVSMGSYSADQQPAFPPMLLSAGFVAAVSAARDSAGSSNAGNSRRMSFVYYGEEGEVQPQRAGLAGVYVPA